MQMGVIKESEMAQVAGEDEAQLEHSIEGRGARGSIVGDFHLQTGRRTIYW